MKQTAGRQQLGDIAPKFAELNDDILFGEVWSRDNLLNLRDRSLITVVVLITTGHYDNSLKYHMNNAKNNGITMSQMVEIITHLAFYAGWPKAWSAFPIMREVYENDLDSESQKFCPLFSIGQPNNAYARYFIGKSYLNMLDVKGVTVANVTFEPACRNNWHIHHKGGQILLCTDGEGIYQEWGKEARFLQAGDVVYIAPEIKHWHGATKDSWFAHIAIEIPAENSSNEWLEKVDDEQYLKLDSHK